MSSLNNSTAKWILVLIAVASISFAIGATKINKLETDLDRQKQKMEVTAISIARLETQLTAIQATLIEIKTDIKELDRR